MLSFLLRLPLNLPLLLLWVLWAPFALIGSSVGLLFAFLAGVIGILALQGEPYGFLPAIVLFAANRIVAQKPLARPPRIVWWRPRERSRTVKPRPVPTVQGLPKTYSAPTASEAYGRLSPALRDVIANPPPSDPA